MIKTLTKNKKWLLIFVMVIFFTLLLPNISLGAEGDLIWSRVNNPSGLDEAPVDVTIDSTGIYVVGNDNAPGNAQWRIEKRSLTDGNLIWSRVNNPSGGQDIAYDVTIDSTGIYVVGNDNAPGNHQWRIEKRSLTDGSLIWSRVNNPSGGSDVAYGVTIDSTGIYVVGYDNALGWRIEKRSLTDGSLIWSRTSNPGVAHDVTIDSTGIYVVGYDNAPGNYQWRIEKRSLTDGSLIWSRVNNPSGGSDVAQDVTIDSTGIYVVGYDIVLGNYQWRIEKRSLTDGNLIWSRTSNPSGGSDVAYGVTIDSTGIYVVGNDNAPGNHQWRIEKRSLTDGSLIWSRVSNPSSGADGARGVTTNSAGIYVVGYDNAPGNAQWRIEKREIAVFVDCGLRYYNGSQIVAIACEPAGTLTSPLRIAKGGVVYGIVLVNPGDANDSGIRIRLASGETKALRKL